MNRYGWLGVLIFVLTGASVLLLHSWETNAIYFAMGVPFNPSEGTRDAVMRSSWLISAAIYRGAEFLILIIGSAATAALWLQFRMLERLARAKEKEVYGLPKE